MWLLPSGDRKDKQLIMNMADRFQLLKKLTEDCGEKVVVSDEEIKLSKHYQRMIPTYDLLQEFSKKHPDC